MYLYRYYSNEDFVLDVLRNRRLYHCLPTEFDDPFDCRPLLTIRYSTADDKTWRRLFYYLAKMEYPDASKEDLSRHADAAFRRGLHRNASWLSEVDESLRNVGAMVRVCCFAKDARNMMMWAHYANNHQGVVLGFRTKFLRDARSGEFRGQDVAYPPQAPGVKEFVAALERGLDHGDVVAMARVVYSTKTKHWRGEEEVRFFSTKERTHLSFPEPALSEVIFGDQCEERLTGRVLDCLRNWEHPPKLFRASISRTIHKLWIGGYGSADTSMARREQSKRSAT